ncbi:MAG: c-type cytochrome [Gammaproteobacteria bacterium]|nr:c-type cytochrome [Gammaproteobacteria bacterium]
MLFIRKLLAVGFLGLTVSGPSSAKEEQFVTLGVQFEAGRQIWLGTCASCHGYGIAGAPIPMQPKAWADRVSKPSAELYDHAINGFFGPGDTYMPPRGGNENLSDNEIQQAVDYMVALAIFYIQKEEKMQ